MRAQRGRTQTKRAKSVEQPRVGQSLVVLNANFNPNMEQYRRNQALNNPFLRPLIAHSEKPESHSVHMYEPVVTQRNKMFSVMRPSQGYIQNAAVTVYSCLNGATQKEFDTMAFTGVALGYRNINTTHSHKTGCTIAITQQGAVTVVNQSGMDISQATVLLWDVCPLTSVIGDDLAPSGDPARVRSPAPVGVPADKAMICFYPLSFSDTCHTSLLGTISSHYMRQNDFVSRRPRFMQKATAIPKVLTMFESRLKRDYGFDASNGKFGRPVTTLPERYVNAASEAGHEHFASDVARLVEDDANALAEDSGVRKKKIQQYYAMFKRYVPVASGTTAGQRAFVLYAYVEHYLTAVKYNDYMELIMDRTVGKSSGYSRPGENLDLILG